MAASSETGGHVQPSTHHDMQSRTGRQQQRCACLESVMQRENGGGEDVGENR